MHELTEQHTIEFGGKQLALDSSVVRSETTFRVGMAVRILLKPAHSAEKVVSGVIVGCESFEAGPRLVVAYVSTNYGTTGLEWATIGPEGAGNLIPMPAGEMLPEREAVLDRLDRDITAKTRELEDLEAKRAYFVETFGRTFGFTEADCAKGTDSGE